MSNPVDISAEARMIGIKGTTYLVPLRLGEIEVPYYDTSMAMEYQRIATELNAMAKADQEMRTQSIKDISLWDDSIDHKNTTRLKEIITQSGWPTITKVGPKASQSAWLIVQHATAEPDFMKRCLGLMQRVKKGDVAPTNIAFLEDRILTMEGKLQVYGTQFHTVDGVTTPFPIEDPEYVDERRARVGLDSFAENQARIKAM